MKERHTSMTTYPNVGVVEKFLNSPDNVHSSVRCCVGCRDDEVITTLISIYMAQ